jgi:adhesin transport system membrane fusion protein
MMQDQNSSIWYKLKVTLQKTLQASLHGLGRALLFTVKKLAIAITFIYRYTVICLTYAYRKSREFVLWCMPASSAAYQRAKTEIVNLPQTQALQESYAQFWVRVEKWIIRFFHLEHLNLDQAGIAHVRLGRPHKMSFVLLKVIGWLFLIMLFWSAIADVDYITHAEGRIIPSARMQVVQNLEGGIVQSINVRQGDKVSAGDVLVVLSPTQFSSEFDSRNQQMIALSAKEIRLRAEIDNTPLVFSPELIENGKDSVTLETAEYNNRISRQKADIAVYENQLKNAKSELDIVTRLVDRGLEPRLELIRTQARVAEASSKLDSLKKQFKAEASADLAKTMQELAPLQKTLPALADKLDRTTLRAPVNGVVNRVLVTTTGGTVKAGDPIVEIVPSDDVLVVEARIRPQDIGFVKLGQDAKVKVTAYDYSIFGSLKGQVTQISADAVSSEERGQTQYYYIARIETDSSVLNSLDRKLPIIPGMQAQVDVITGHKTVLRYLLKPLIGVKENAFRER